jgi:hypothetical protein
MLHFEREATHTPRLVVVDGGRSHRAARLPFGSIRNVAPVALVVLATLFAVVVDLLDGVRAWSPIAVAASAVVLAVHAALSRRH